MRHSRRSLWLVLPCVLYTTAGASWAAMPCGTEKQVEVLAPVSLMASTVQVDCDLNLQPQQQVTKTILLEGVRASGVTINCRSAQVGNIEINSRRYLNTTTGNIAFERPERITIQQCRINGHVRITGMPTQDIIPASKQANFTAVARQNAPIQIVLKNLTITANKHLPLSIPVYISPGVTGVQLLDSTLKGSSSSVAVYLDAESYNNQIRGNQFNVVTGREVIAIDGSSYNIIENNRFSGLSKGGIFLYRNCGERGAIRHATPSYNLISNNYFYYDHYWGRRPAIFIGARDGQASYCQADLRSDGQPFPFGSSLSDLDYAQYNQILNNQIRKKSVESMIRVQHPSINANNKILGNQTISN